MCWVVNDQATVELGLRYSTCECLNITQSSVLSGWNPGNTSDSAFFDDVESDSALQLLQRNANRRTNKAHEMAENLAADGKAPATNAHVRDGF